jgi:hypothetical protein
LILNALAFLLKQNTAKSKFAHLIHLTSLMIVSAICSFSSVATWFCTDIYIYIRAQGKEEKVVSVSGCLFMLRGQGRKKHYPYEDLAK